MKSSKVIPCNRDLRVGDAVHDKDDEDSEWSDAEVGNSHDHVECRVPEPIHHMQIVKETIDSCNRK